jgi:Electron transfer DM13
MNQQDIMNTAKQMSQNQKNMITIGAAQVNNSVNENIVPAVESNNLQTNKSSTGSIIRTGSFVGASDGFHNAEGIAKLIPLKDRSNILRLENFKSTNGPDVHIYLSTDKTISDSIDLGKLKANNGNQNYDIPIGTNLPKYKIVLIWCKPFSVLFGSAESMT